MSQVSPELQGSLFEHDYLVRSVGSLAVRPDLALTELVANAWDAGASAVVITIPDELGGLVTIEDDGLGMTRDEFLKRWMTLGYNRVRYQGEEVDFPPGREDWRRKAYGRNGVGRHGMLCFADRYAVTTRNHDEAIEVVVEAVSGKDPFRIRSLKPGGRSSHGTTLTAHAVRNLPNPDRIRRVLAMRFLHDPQFSVRVNGETVGLEELDGRIDAFGLDVQGMQFSVSVIAHDAKTRTIRPGIAFWVGGRLVGEPSWVIGRRALVDGRTTVGRKHTIVVRSRDLHDHVLPDWTGFKETDEVRQVLDQLADRIDSIIERPFSDRVQETQEQVVRRHRAEIESLPPSAKREVSRFVTAVTSEQPAIRPDLLSAAVRAVINLEKSRSGVALLNKLSELDPEDVDGLDRLLEDWTVSDALAVLDEIDRRLSVVEALERLEGDPTADELHVLHPLVSQCRWLFGPQFDSPMFSSNQTLRNAVNAVFGKKLGPEAFINPRRRPDLVSLSDSTLSVVGSDGIDRSTQLASLQEVLLIELKRGRSTVGRAEVSQAEGYVQDFQHAGLDGSPYFHAFIVGHARDDKVDPVRKIGEPETARVQVTTYAHLVRSAEARLFKLREELTDRYQEAMTDELLDRAFSGGGQLELDTTGADGAVH